MKIFISIIFLVNSVLLSNQHYTKCGFLESLEHTGRNNPPSYNQTIESDNFIIHYTTSETTQSFAQKASDIAENVRDDYIDLGYNEPVYESDGKYYIFINERDCGSYGVNRPYNDGTSRTFIEIDNDFLNDNCVPGSDPLYFTTGTQAQKITLAHEYFHAIQRTYKEITLNVNSYSGYFYELSATWAEEILYPNINDYIYWVNPFFDNLDIEIDDTDGYSIAFYGHYLSSEIGNNSIMREIWEKFENSNSNIILSTLDEILNDDYSIDFTTTWVDFCSRNFFNNEYSNMNNNFYFHEDQVYAEPIFIPSNNIIDLNNSKSISGSLTNKQINLYSYTSDSNLAITINNINSNFYVKYVITSDSKDNYRVKEINNGDYIYLTANDELHILIGTFSSDAYDINIDIESFDFGDINKNGIINLADIILLINHIYNGDILDSEYLALADSNGDNIYDITDITYLVSVINDLDS